ncbi:MAG: hypothetical protein QW461_09830 [Candidatus Jordarchaeales archaeon]
MSKKFKFKFRPSEDKGYAEVIVGAFLLYIFGILFWSPMVLSYSITLWSFLVFLAHSIAFNMTPPYDTVFFFLCLVFVIPMTLSNEVTFTFCFKGAIAIFIATQMVAWYLTRKIFQYKFSYISLTLLLPAFLSGLSQVGGVTGGIPTLNYLFLFSYISVLRSEFTAFQLQLFMLVNFSNELFASAMRFTLSSFIPLSAGLMLLHAGTERISNAIEKHERGGHDKYKTSLTLTKIKIIPEIIITPLPIPSFSLLTRPTFTITLVRKENDRTQITIKVFSFMAFGAGRMHRYSRYHRYFRDEINKIGYDIKMALEKVVRWPPGKPPSSDWLEGDLT